MNIRELQVKDEKAVREIFALYWTDPDFLNELSSELDLYLKNDSNRNSYFFVAETEGEIVGVSGFKKLPDYMKPCAITEKPVEFYVIASKYKRKGIGSKLTLKLIEEAKSLGFSEILLYSPHTHKGSWIFYENSGFEKVAEITPPEDEVGQLFRKLL